MLDQSQRDDVAQAVLELKAQSRGDGSRAGQRAARADRGRSEPAAIRAQAGKSAFGDNCATCHGSGAQGFKGYPNLNDDVWLWGGTLDDIHQTIEVGVRSPHPDTRLSQMPAFGRDELLEPEQIDDLTEYVLSISGRKADRAGGRARAQPVFKEQCAVCHGDDGKGKREFGAPNLTDEEWLYGGERGRDPRADRNGRGGVMPTWGSRLDPVTIDALAVYVHRLGGGE